ncbi:MAG: long-chain fatty acid--CoA ligase [Clostridiales bacterium]|nr:long-chain fatty acid--CoA ligase [Clostridiales bacterium]
MQTKAPWLSSYKNVPHSLNYPDCSMFQLIQDNAKNYQDYIAYEFMGHKVTYQKFIENVHTCAKGLKVLGFKPGDRITICMPNTPQGVTMFYAINLMGCISNMIHPLSSEGEIKFYLNHSHSKGILILDAFLPKLENIIWETPDLEKVMVASISTELNFIKKVGFKLTKGKKIPKIPRRDNITLYSTLMEMGQDYTGEYVVQKKADDPAAILYSGGTTGTTKGIILTNLNFNSLAMQTIAAGDCVIKGHKMLSIMPIFHGFGLGVCIHTMLVGICRCILVPQFSVETYAQLLKKVQPNYIAGVPTLYEALLRSKNMKNVNLACLEGVFSGGDSLSIELKRKVDTFLREHHATVQIREGYGTTECVTASCLTPKSFFKEGSIGIPFPDTFYKIVKASTKNQIPYGDEGEICISGPSVMKEYLDNLEETEAVLQLHEDGRIWLHTGDLGTMDDEGFVYYKQRLKRMIISSGYSIYPSQLENIIDAHPDVLMCTVIGVPDPYKVQKVKAFVVLKNGVSPNDDVRESISQHCVKNIAKYAMPYEFEFRDNLPQTLVGKVAYTVLEKEELANLAEKNKLQKKNS